MIRAGNAGIVKALTMAVICGLSHSNSINAVVVAMHNNEESMRLQEWMFWALRCIAACDVEARTRAVNT